MKRLLLHFLIAGLCFACGQDPVTDPGDMGAVPPADAVAPVFAPGGMGVQPVSGTALWVTWPTAVDDVTGRALLEYRLYFSSISNLTTVAAVTNNGIPAMAWTRDIQEWPVTGLTPTNTYYLAVLVRDQAGNMCLHPSLAGMTGLPAGMVDTVSVAGHGIRFARCPGGVFPVGSTDVYTSELEQADPCWLAVTELAYGQWFSVYTWATNNGYVFVYPGQEGSAGTPGAAPSAASNQPAINMCWRDALVWCNAASEMAGLTPVYRGGEAGPVLRFSTNRSMLVPELDMAYMDPLADGFRMLTQAEWSCAARYRDGFDWTLGNTASGACCPASHSWTTNYGWYSLNAGGATHPVGGLLPNQLGCFDMSGNAGEFLFDAVNYAKQASIGMTASSIGVGSFVSLSANGQNTAIGMRLARSIVP